MTEVELTAAIRDRHDEPPLTLRETIMVESGDDLADAFRAYGDRLSAVYRARVQMRALLGKATRTYRRPR